MEFTQNKASTAPLRAHTWPPTTFRLVTDGKKTHPSQCDSLSGPALSKPNVDFFEEALDQHPEQYFLSPVHMYEYEDWASDSDDDDDDDEEEIEFDAGIVDFGLFKSDHNRATQLNASIPRKWDDLLSSQASALDRADERSRQEPSSTISSKTPSTESLPGLTPDNSPRLRDDLDSDSRPALPSRSRSVPSYLSHMVLPVKQRMFEISESDEDEDDDDEDEDDDMPLSVLLQRSKDLRAASAKLLKPERPGLKYNRTLSGKLHVWRRPSLDIYPVREDPAAERKSELAMVHMADVNDRHHQPSNQR